MKTVNRPPVAKDRGHKKERRIPWWLRGWFWYVFDRTLKAFFDAFFNHYGA